MTFSLPPASLVFWLRTVEVEKSRKGEQEANRGLKDTRVGGESSGREERRRKPRSSTCGERKKWDDVSMKHEFLRRTHLVLFFRSLYSPIFEIFAILSLLASCVAALAWTKQILLSRIIDYYSFFCRVRLYWLDLMRTDKRHLWSPSWGSWFLWHLSPKPTLWFFTQPLTKNWWMWWSYAWKFS